MMGVSPRMMVDSCLECGAQPGVEVKGFFTQRARLACICGVSGSWRFVPGSHGYRDPWHTALTGWHGVKNCPAPPPPKGR